MDNNDDMIGRIDRVLERKVAATTWAIYIERLWPRVWVIVGVAALFVLVSVAQLWESLPAVPHAILLGSFAAALVFSILYLFFVRWPRRDEAIARMEHLSGVKHRPATSYEDTLSSTDDPTTRNVWHAHRARLAKLVQKLKVSGPRPRTDRFDPLAMRAALLLLIVSVFGLTSENIIDSVSKAFAFEKASGAAQLRIDAWIAPPAYTGKQPIMLADGGATETAKTESNESRRLIEIPANSELIVRGSGPNSASSSDKSALSLEVQESGKKPFQVNGKAVVTPSGTIDGVWEVRAKFKNSARVGLLVDETPADHWTFAVTPDQFPKIELSKPPTTSRRGSMKLSYKATDDYGLATATAKVKKAPTKAGDPSTQWARGALTLDGPRFPLERPPELPLRLPRANAKNGEAFTSLELAAHPWAGLRVIMTLEAVDVAGQAGRSEPFEIVLPQRRFTNPMARAVIEQRRKLAEDSRYRPHVRRALDALTIGPERFIDDIQVYLGLRTAIHRLEQDSTRKGLRSVVDQLWHVALRIEDGDLSDAERRLKEAQDKLAKALKDGASDQDIRDAMEELRQALNDYMQQMQKQAQDNPLDQDQNGQSLSSEELEQMMQDLENQALNGSREQAEQMLAELRDMLDRMEKNQSTKMTEAQRQQQQRAMEQLNKLSGIIGEQQELMDDTFQQKDGQQQGEGESQNQQGGTPSQQQGQQQGGQLGEGRAGKQGSSRGQQGGQRGRGKPQAGGRAGPEGLQQRQRDLAQRLDELERDVNRTGRGSAEQLQAAREAMENADQALQDKDYREAARQQAQALEAMRESAQEMAQELTKGDPQQAGGQQPNDSPRDPLGRPQRTQGPQLGTSVKVPDEIDMQRAREILRELRERVGDPKRRAEEIEYFERLLRRF